MNTEELYKLNSLITDLADKVSNMEGWIKDVDLKISNYIFANPKRDDDFVEQRLIALEDFVKGQKDYHEQINKVLTDNKDLSLKYDTALDCLVRTNKILTETENG